MRRLAPAGRHPPPICLEAVARGGTCPLLGDFPAATLGCSLYRRDLEGFL